MQTTCDTQHHTQVSDSDKAALVADVAAALYCSKICSYAQGMNIIRARSEAEGWGVELGQLARIWKVRGIACTSVALRVQSACCLHV